MVIWCYLLVFVSALVLRREGTAREFTGFSLTVNVSAMMPGIRCVTWKLSLILPAGHLVTLGDLCSRRLSQRVRCHGCDVIRDEEDQLQG